jgi:hypothetical protein
LKGEELVARPLIGKIELSRTSEIERPSILMDKNAKRKVA